MTLPGVYRRGSCIVYLRAVQIQHSIWDLLTNPSDRPPSPFSAFPATGAGPPKAPPPGTAGSACHRGKASRGYAALGLDKRTAAGVLRLSFGPETTEGDIDVLYEALLRHKNTRFSML